MPPRRRSPSERLAHQAFELSVAAPQVVAQRLTRMALAGHAPTARDRDEMMRMGSEKVVAFHESWAAMWMQLWQAQWTMAQSMMSAGLATSMGGSARPSDWMATLPLTATRILSAGLQPVHGKAVANAKRLARRRK